MHRGSQPTGSNPVQGGGQPPTQPPGLFNQNGETAALKGQVETLARDLQMLTQRLGNSGPSYSGMAPRGGIGPSGAVLQASPHNQT